MSDADSRKSMDDVLASIRRIVRAEKNPEEGETSMDTTPPFDEAAEAPLELTPNMRMDVGSELDHPMDSEQTAATMATNFDEASLKSMIKEVLLEELQSDQAGELVRSVIRDELVNGEVGSNISQNVMNLIQSEVSKALAR